MSLQQSELDKSTSYYFPKPFIQVCLVQEQQSIFELGKGVCFIACEIHMEFVFFSCLVL